jgi:hypothetical protein
MVVAESHAKTQIDDLFGVDFYPAVSQFKKLLPEKASIEVHGHRCPLIHRTCLLIGQFSPKAELPSNEFCQHRQRPQREIEGHGLSVRNKKPRCSVRLPNRTCPLIGQFSPKVELPSNELQTSSTSLNMQ